MATWMSSSEEDLSCPVCQEIFNNPVVLSCSHSFCKSCLQSWWAQKEIPLCPVCKRRSSRSDPPCNLALKNLCEAFTQNLSLQQRVSSGSEGLRCSLHSETLRLFCLDHQQPVCVVCRDSKTHTNHSFRPINEAAEDLKEDLRKSLKPLQDHMECFNRIKLDWAQLAKHIKVQAQQTEGQIREEFQRIYQFLQKEEEARINALRKEEQQKRKTMRKMIEDLDKQIAALSDTVRAAEQELKADHVSFLQSYKATAARVQQQYLQDEPQLHSRALIDVAKHVGNLSFHIWDKMKDMVTYSPVILDPNTAHQNLVVSNDLTSIRYIMSETERQPLRNLERFENYFIVRGCEGFILGSHSWEVEVINKSGWAVGVIQENVSRRGKIEFGYWEIWFIDGKYLLCSPPLPDKVLTLKKPIKRIRVNLDCNKGKLMFTDADTNTHIHTFSHTFTETLYPYINTDDTQPMRILPVKVTAKLEM